MLNYQRVISQTDDDIFNHMVDMKYLHSFLVVEHFEQSQQEDNTRLNLSSNRFTNQCLSTGALHKAMLANFWHLHFPSHSLT